jgi:hypothetical protein
MAEDILGYLKKYPAHGYFINPKPPSVDPKYETAKLKEDFGGQYTSIFKKTCGPKNFLSHLYPKWTSIYLSMQTMLMIKSQEDQQ